MLPYTTITLLGPSGSGKTTLVEEIAKDPRLGIDKFVTLRMQGMAAEDFRLPIIVDETDVKTGRKKSEETLLNLETGHRKVSKSVEFANIGIFKEIIDNLYKEAFKKDNNLPINVELKTISSAFDIDINKVYESLSKDLGITLKSPEQAATYVNDERYRRFNEMIDKRFSDSVLIELLNCFENRDDKRIEELVTDEATIPTIFEYVLGIIWYKVSERQGNILEFMQLSLEANLLPKTHAAGGYADIIYKYEACLAYPKHTLLLEATLADGTNQRRMEMEPVSRHLGDYRIRFNNPFDYSLFVSTYLDKNVISDFRYRKIIPYTKDKESITGMKIISMDTESLKKIIENNIKYKYLYKVFDKYHEMPLDTIGWHAGMIKEATEEYKV